MRRLLLCSISIFTYLTLNSSAITAQVTPTIPASKEIRSSTGSWLGLYTKYHFNNRWSYYGEYHFRRKNGLKDMGQIYLRLGATFKLTQYLDLTAGFVNPYYWAPDQSNPNMDKIVPQFRLWEQAVLATPFYYIKVLHQLRLEQRYRRDYIKGSPWELTHRFRYKLSMYIPLNNRELKPKTVFLSLYDEIFIQAGKTIVYNHLEDNRAFLGLGYKLNENLQIQAGYMNSWRHDGAPWMYESRHIFRFNIFHQMDLKKDIQPKIWDVPLN